MPNLRQSRKRSHEILITFRTALRRRVRKDLREHSSHGCSTYQAERLFSFVRIGQ